MSTFVATDPEGYEQYVGRVSQRLAPVFVNHVGIGPQERVLDVGCGTGNLTIALGVAKAHATGVDLSAPYVEFARRRASGPGLAFDVGDALNLPYPDGKFDRSLSMLAVDVLPDPKRGLSEMRRVTRPGGVVAVLVNDFRCGWTPFSLVWDAAAVLDPRGAAVRDEMVSKPLGWAGGLAALFRLVDLLDIRESRVGAMFEYSSFEDYWSTFLTGQGKTGSYVTGLGEAPQRDLKQHVQAAYLCGMPDGKRSFSTSFWVVQGTVPTRAT
jgi:SAM-dependent methyltransferase